jgi:hypothetical protein
MAKRGRHSHHLDPGYEQWERKYPRFPGVAECARLIRAGKARGPVAEIIVHELAENAVPCLPELIDVFHTDPSGDVRMYVMMALDIARPPEAVSFLAEVLRDGDPRFAHYAESALQALATREARTALWKAKHRTQSS